MLPTIVRLHVEGHRIPEHQNYRNTKTTSTQKLLKHQNYRNIKSTRTPWSNKNPTANK